MNTKFPYQGQIDFEKYLDAYLQQEDAICRIPTDSELKELARKAIVREHLVLTPLPEQEPAMAGDTAVLRTDGPIPKFQKQRVTVTLGRGLYHKALENALVGCKVGENAEAEIPEGTVNATILELKRKQAPEPTDDMVVQLNARDHRGNLICTVADYEKFIHDEKIMSTLGAVNFYVMNSILEDYPMTEFDEEDILALGQLEKQSFAAILKEQGIDPDTQVPKEWEEDMGIHSLDEFIEKRREWYQMKIRQCLIFLNILGLPCEGKNDPLDHYEVLSELQNQMFDKIRDALERRNAQ